MRATPLKTDNGFRADEMKRISEKVRTEKYANIFADVKEEIIKSANAGNSFTDLKRYSISSSKKVPNQFSASSFEYDTDCLQRETEIVNWLKSLGFNTSVIKDDMPPGLNAQCTQTRYIRVSWGLPSFASCSR